MVFKGSSWSRRQDRCLISWNNKTAVVFHIHEVVGVRGLRSDKRKGAKFRQISN